MRRLSDRAWKLRGVFVLASIPIGLTLLVWTLMPTHSHVLMHHQLDFENAHPHGKSSSSNIIINNNIRINDNSDNHGQERRRQRLSHGRQHFLRPISQ